VSRFAYPLARGRKASKRCAGVSIFSSAPVSVLNALLFLKLVKPGGSTERWSFAAVTLIPLIVAISVFCFDQNHLRNHNEVSHADQP